MSVRPQYGETWVYESIVGALPGVDLSEAQAVAIQLKTRPTRRMASALREGRRPHSEAGSILE